ncbi:hypothetical protein [Janibacter cremeus]|uniref:ABC-type proline/glycine betaine transport system permease subunit n=1 Tax=Janibacter cremeus TaxID=1285192 RepID=A0A852VRZ3_9MICO|nr:hypothetical protein [Janibacter cremeus]NYF97104.1 ABC-type proline/glycine betaine transport system permease subunit [Janibacter cremeus]
MEIGAGVVVVVAVAYGLGFAILSTREWSEEARRRYTLGGALLIAVLAIVLLAIPW